MKIVAFDEIYNFVVQSFSAAPLTPWGTPPCPTALDVYVCKIEGEKM
jgi:hypothetical protein